MPSSRARPGIQNGGRLDSGVRRNDEFHGREWRLSQRLLFLVLESQRHVSRGALQDRHAFQRTRQRQAGKRGLDNALFFELAGLMRKVR